MNFISDNAVGVAPEIMSALAEANRGPSMPYGADDWTRRVERKMAEIFEHEVRVFPVATGTAANALSLACLTPPYGSIYAHEEAHVMADECGAPELFSGGAKLRPLPGAHGKLTAETLDRALKRDTTGDVHQVIPATISLTQATEAGTVYQPAELQAIAEVARRHKVRLHMDGARFANAMAFLGVPARQVTWEAGIDVLSFGASKGGCMAAEAVVFFNPALAESFGHRRMRGGHLVSKMRFVSAQLEAYLTDGLWLRLARHANAMAQRLTRGLSTTLPRLPGARLLHPVEGNELFVQLPASTIAGLRQAGFEFYDWPVEEGTAIRLVTAFNTEAAHVELLLKTVEELAGRATVN
ncbi:threonine aldolase family protein [Dongia deserti]|uniref:threonine aldolase family protein n=1 Tax=Dongia deserti TaxID=2268030 RepID=UPI000E649446|nr:low specificity L-threonine aldolase [Dongia deserti]